MPITKKQELTNVPISKLIPYAKNPRKNDAAVQRVAKSLEEFGLVKNSIVVDEDMVLITGHTTTKAMQSLGWDTAPDVTQVFGLTAAQKQAYRIADNKLGELAEWDTELLGLELEELRGLDFDIELTGFDEEEFDDMLKELHKGDEVQDAEPQVNRAEELQKEWHTELGQMWQCGEHRVICGDCTDSGVVERLMQGEKADMVFTDPPYNINYGNIKHPKFKVRKIENDSMSSENWELFCELTAELIAKLTTGCVYVCHAPGKDGRVMAQVLDSCFHSSTTIIWNKDVFTLGRGKYQNKYEPIWFGWVDDGKRFCSDRTLTNVWDVKRPKASVEHPTMKPVELVSLAISHATITGGTAADPFLGSGTTMIACENLGRKCRGCEIDPGYVAVILQRYKDTFPDKEIKLL